MAVMGQGRPRCGTYREELGRRIAVGHGVLCVRHGGLENVWILSVLALIQMIAAGSMARLGSLQLV